MTIGFFLLAEPSQDVFLHLAILHFPLKLFNKYGQFLKKETALKYGFDQNCTLKLFIALKTSIRTNFLGFLNFVEI